MTAKFGCCPVRPILIAFIIFSLFSSIILMSDVITKRNSEGRIRPRTSTPFSLLTLGYGCYHLLLAVAVSRNDLKMMRVARYLSASIVLICVLALILMPVYWTASAADGMFRNQIKVSRFFNATERFDAEMFRQTFFHAVHDGYRIVRFLLLTAGTQYLAYVMLNKLWNHETYAIRMANRREFARLSQV